MEAKDEEDAGPQSDINEETSFHFGNSSPKKTDVYPSSSESDSGRRRRSSSSPSSSSSQSCSDSSSVSNAERHSSKEHSQKAVKPETLVSDF